MTSPREHQTWHLRSREINEVVLAEDQYAAWDTLRERPAVDFGLIVTAEPDETADSIPVHTSALMTWWERHEDAALFRQVAIENDLPNTFESDHQFAEARNIS